MTEVACIHVPTDIDMDVPMAIHLCLPCSNLALQPLPGVGIGVNKVDNVGVEVGNAGAEAGTKSKLTMTDARL